jgi:hypothetical protein
MVHHARRLSQSNPRGIRQAQVSAERLAGGMLLGVVAENTGWDFGPITLSFLTIVAGMALSVLLPDLVERFKGMGGRK